MSAVTVVGSASSRPPVSVMDVAAPSPRPLLVVGVPGTGSAPVPHELGADGFDVRVASTREHARLLAADAAPEMVVIGFLEGAREPLALLEEIRDDQGTGGPWNPDVPVIVVGERGGLLDALRAFDLGADDFLAAPADYLELRARVRAVLRRCRGCSRRRLTVGPLEINLTARAVSVHGRSVSLSRREYELLCALASEPGRVFTREELLRDVWGFRSLGTTRTLDSHASRLRRKLAGAGDLIDNVWGVGYRLVA